MLLLLATTFYYRKMAKLIYKKCKNILRKTPFFIPAKKLYYFIRGVALKFYNAIFPTAIILLYHRIAEPENDIYQLSVSSENFENQLIYLSNKFKIISLNELANSLKSRKLGKGRLVITFDDGYADNLHNALPILEKYGIPATIFITTSNIDNGAPFFWEEGSPEKDRGRCVNREELKKLSSSKFIEIGAHTINHPKLSKINISEQAEEIAGSRQTLNKLLGMPINSFAYPFGGKGTFEKNTVNLVKKNGFQYACSNIHRRVGRNTPLHTLPRFVVRNWSVKELKQQMEKWL